MRWYKVELAGTRANASTIEEILVAIGAISISMTNKSKKDIYEPGVGETPLWELINISALFEQKILEKDIASALNLIEYSNLSISELEETNWIESYQKNFQPIKFGGSYGPWFEDQTGPNTGANLGTVLVANSSVSVDTAYQITKVLCENAESIS